MRRELLEKEIDLVDGVTVEYAEGILKAKGAKGEVSKKLQFPGLEVSTKDGKLVLSIKNVGRREKMFFGTAVAHAKNVIQGASEGYIYKLKICSGHFPMNVKLAGNTFSVVNYIGEKVPRILKIKEGANVKIDGDFITVEANNKELAGQVAADIELLTRLTNKDRRIYQDGIYIIEKNGKEL